MTIGIDIDIDSIDRSCKVFPLGTLFSRCHLDAFPTPISRVQLYKAFIRDKVSLKTSQQIYLHQSLWSLPLSTPFHLHPSTHTGEFYWLLKSSPPTALFLAPHLSSLSSFSLPPCSCLVKSTDYILC